MKKIVSKKTKYLSLALGVLFFLSVQGVSAMTKTECESPAPAGKGGTCQSSVLGSNCTSPSRGNPGQTDIGPCLGGKSGNQNLGSCCVNNKPGGGNPVPSPGGGNPTPTPGGGNPTPTPGGGNPTPTPGGGNPTPGGTGTGGTMTVIKFSNPLQYDTVEEVFTSVIGTAQTIVILLALVFIIIGALIYITSAGDSKRIDWAKKAISASLIGLVIIMVAPSFLKEIANVLGWDDVSGVTAQALTITQIATRVLNFLLSIIGIIAIIMFLIGAIMYLTSAGDDKKATTAKDIVKAATIGMIVAFSALVIVRQLADFFI